MAPTTTSSKQQLAKGAACANCKARKVRCDAVRPACTACKRSARFRGEDPSNVCCSYFDGKRCSTGGKTKRTRAAKAPSVDVETTAAGLSSSSEAAVAVVMQGEQAPPSLPSPPLEKASFPPQPAALAIPPPPLASTSASTPHPSSTFPSTGSTIPQQFPLPAPIAVYPSTVPTLLAHEPLPPPCSSIPTQSDFDSFLDSLAVPNHPLPYSFAYSSEPSASAQPDWPRTGDSPSSPSSSSSLSSFDFSDGSISSTSSGSPFSLCEDYDLAFATSPPPFSLLSDPAATLSSKWSPDGVLDPHAFDDAFLPTAHDFDKTLALPLFPERLAFSPLG